MPISLFAPNSPIGSLIGQAAPAYAPPPTPTFGSVAPTFQRNTPMKMSATFGPSMDQAALQSDFAAPITTTPGVPSKIGFSAGESKDSGATTGYGPIADAAMNRNIGGTTTGSTGSSASLGGDWAGVDQWTNDINAAAAATGVDANDLKGIMKLESNGDPGAAGAPGVGGLMQVNSSVWGSGPWQTDNAANILKGAQIYKSYLDQYGGDKTMALRAYHGFGSDGYTTDQQYADTVMANINQLNAGGGGSGRTGTSAGLQGMFGPQAAVPDWGAFNVASSNGLYGYGTQYGLNGTNHTGEDIPLAYGTPMNVPFSGTVVCSGTGVGPGTDGGGCAAFQDTIGGGAGRIEVLSDDGNTVLIFGHSSRAAANPGTHLNAGSLVGWSGGENSEHVHLEARVRDASMPSGWRIVDPSTVIGQGGIPSSVSSRFANIGQELNPLRSFLERQR